MGTDRESEYKIVEPPFSVGISLLGPICPVMCSCCLSAGSFRFLILPVPTEAFCLPCGWLTERIDHLSDLFGVATFHMCETQLGRMPPVLRGRGCPFP